MGPVSQQVHEGRKAERAAICAFIRARGKSAFNVSQRNVLLTEAEAKRLDRWLDAVAFDIEAELHLP